MTRSFTGFRLLAVCALVLFAGATRADVTGGTTISNTVEVSYTDVAGSGTFTDTATISIEVVVIRSFEWANYSSGVDLDGGDTVTEADGHTHISVDLANNGNLSQTVTFTVNEDYRDLNDTGGLIWYFCNGDGSANNDGAADWPADDVGCSTAADTNSSPVFSHGIKEWPSSSFSASNDSIAVELWDTPSDIEVGDVVMFDGDETALFKVTGVSGTTVTVQEDDPANANSTRFGTAIATTPGTLQEVVRLVAYGTAPNIPATGSVLDGSHESITWELEAATSTAGELTGFAWCTYVCTDDTAVVTGTTSTTETETGGPTLDDRTGSEIAVAILAPAIRIFKYVSATGAQAETTDTDCVDRTYDGTSGYFGDEDPGAGDGCLLENVEDDATITYLLRVMNGLDTLASGAFAASELGDGSSSFQTTCIAANPPIAASAYDDQCVGTATEVIVEDTYDATYGQIVTNTAFIDEDCDGSQEDTDTTASDNGKIWDNGTTLDFFPDNADVADETGSDNSTTPVGGTIYGGTDVCLVYEVQLATEAL